MRILLAHRAVAGVLMALVVLVLSAAPAAAFVTHTVLDVVADFSGGTFQRTGLVSSPEEGVHGVQLMPIGLTGEWVTDRLPLPAPVQESAVAAWGTNIYVLGGSGSDGYAKSTVYCLRMNSDGSVASIAYGQSPLPKGLKGASAFVQEISGQPYIYVVGGLAGGTDISQAVYRSAINTGTGQTGVWTDITAVRPDGSRPGLLPFGMYYSALAVRGSDVYLIGGIAYSGAFVTHPNVFRSVVLPDGSLSSWTNQIGPEGPDGRVPSELPASFAAGVAAAKAVVFESESRDTIYLMGGRSQADQQDESSALVAVAVADIDEQGNLSAWAESSAHLPVPMHGHGAVLVGGSEILIAGGRTNLTYTGEEDPSDVKAALIDPDNPDFPLFDWNPDPTVWEAWQTGVPFPADASRAYHGMAQVGEWVYVLGGSDSSNSATATIFRGRISGESRLYAPNGTYESPTITVYGGTDVQLAPEILRVEWNTVLPLDEENVPLGRIDLEYSWRPMGGDWTPWSALPPSVNGANSYAFTPVLENAAQFRFRAAFASAGPDYNRTPRLESFRVVYDAAPADLAVGSLVSNLSHVRPGDSLTYTAAYQNAGGVVAEGARLTCVLPPYLTSMSPAWVETEPGSHMYTYELGDVAAGGSGTAKMTARVEQIPEGVESLLTTVIASYPNMTDLDGYSVGDPNPSNDSYALTISATPLAVVGTVSATPASGSAVSPGDSIEYRLSFEVQGGTGTSGLVVSVPFDSTKLTGVIPLDGGVLEGSTVRWYYLNAVEAGFQATVRFQAQVRRPLANGTTIAIGFSASSTDLPAAIVGSVSHTVVSQPRLSLQPAADPVGGSAVVPGQTITYRLTALNSGGEAAAGAVVTLTLGDGLRPVSTEPAASLSGQTATWSLGALGLDSPRELKIVARVDDNTMHGQTVAVAAQLSASNAGPATAEVAHQVRIPARLSVTKSVEPATGAVPPGGLLTYRLDVTNLGGETSGMVVATDRLPAYTTDVDGLAVNLGLRWELGPLAGSQSATVTYRVRVMDPISESVTAIVGLAAKATAEGTSASSGTTLTPVRHPANLWVTVDDGRNTVKPGDVLAYTVEYGNRGTSIEGVVLQVKLGTGLEWRGGSGWLPAGDGQYTLAVGQLGTEARRTTFQAAVAANVPVNDPTFGLRVDASIASLGAEADPYDNQGVDIDILDGPDLAVVSLEPSPARPTRNQYLSFRVVVANEGSTPLSGYETAAGLDHVVVEVYVRPAVSAPPSGPTDSLGGYCPAADCAAPRPAFRQSVPISALGPGQKVTVDFPYVTQLASAGLLDLYAQVDVGSDANNGGFREGNEVNNVFSLRRFLVEEVGPESGSYHLPLVGNSSIGY